MLNMANLQPADVLMDLGSGDGRIVIAAALRGIRAIGIECDPHLFEISKSNASQAGAGSAEFILGDLFEADLSCASVITMFLDRDPHIRLLRKLANLKPGVRLITNTFELWENCDEREAETGEYFKTVRMWMVP